MPPERVGQPLRKGAAGLRGLLSWLPSATSCPRTCLVGPGHKAGPQRRLGMRKTRACRPWVAGRSNVGLDSGWERATSSKKGVGGTGRQTRRRGKPRQGRPPRGHEEAKLVPCLDTAVNRSCSGSALGTHPSDRSPTKILTDGIETSDTRETSLISRPLPGHRKTVLRRLTPETTKTIFLADLPQIGANVRISLEMPARLRWPDGLGTIRAKGSWKALGHLGALGCPAFAGAALARDAHTRMRPAQLRPSVGAFSRPTSPRLGPRSRGALRPGRISGGR